MNGLEQYREKISDMILSYKVDKNGYPEEYEQLVQEAVKYKRMGKYEEATKIYIDILEKDKKMYPDILYYLYKVYMCAEKFEFAVTMLGFSTLAVGILARVKTPYGNKEYIIPTQQFTQMHRFATALFDENNTYKILEELVRSYSGNEAYKFTGDPLSFLMELKKASDVLSDMTDRVANTYKEDFEYCMNNPMPGEQSIIQPSMSYDDSSNQNNEEVKESSQNKKNTSNKRKNYYQEKKEKIRKEQEEKYNIYKIIASIGTFILLIQPFITLIPIFFQKDANLVLIIPVIIICFLMEIIGLVGSHMAEDDIYKRITLSGLFILNPLQLIYLADAKPVLLIPVLLIGVSILIFGYIKGK